MMADQVLEFLLDRLPDVFVAQSIATVHEQVFSSTDRKIRALNDHEQRLCETAHFHATALEERLGDGSVCLAVNDEDDSLVRSIAFRLVLPKGVDLDNHLLALND